MSVRLRRVIESRREDARRAAVEDLHDWARRLERVGYPGDGPPDGEALDLLGAVAAEASPEPQVAEDLDRVTLDEVRRIRRRISPQRVVGLRLRDYRGVQAGAMEPGDVTFLLPEPLHRRLAPIDDTVFGGSSVELTWALRISLVVKAAQRLEQCDVLLNVPAERLADPVADRARAFAAILPVSSALAATDRLKPAVAPCLLYLMMASVIDTWIEHELEADAEEASSEGIDPVRTRQALAEREGTLRWLDRVVESLGLPGVR